MTSTSLSSPRPRGYMYVELMYRRSSRSSLGDCLAATMAPVHVINGWPLHIYRPVTFYMLIGANLYDIYQPGFTSWVSIRYSHSDLTDRPPPNSSQKPTFITFGQKKRADSDPTEAAPSLNRNRPELLGATLIYLCI